MNRRKHSFEGILVKFKLVEYCLKDGFKKKRVMFAAKALLKEIWFNSTWYNTALRMFLRKNV